MKTKRLLLLLNCYYKTLKLLPTKIQKYKNTLSFNIEPIRIDTLQLKKLGILNT